MTVVCRLAIVLCIVLTGATGCGKKDAPKGSDTPAPRPAQMKDGQARDPSSKDPLFNGKVADIIQEFKKNRAAADRKYKGGVVEVEGVVRLTPSPFDKGRENQLEVGIDGTEIISVIECQMKPEQTAKCRELGKTQRVKIRGHVFLSTGIGQLLLDNCELLDAGPNPATKIAAKDFAKEASNYKGKQLLVGGIVANIQEKRMPGRERFVFLDSGTADQMQCHLDGGVTDGDFKGLSKGSKVTLRGYCKVEIRNDKNYPVLEDAYIVNKE